MIRTQSIFRRWSSTFPLVLCPPPFSLCFPRVFEFGPSTYLAFRPCLLVSFVSLTTFRSFRAQTTDTHERRKKREDDPCTVSRSTTQFRGSNPGALVLPESRHLGCTGLLGWRRMLRTLRMIRAILRLASSKELPDRND